MARFALRLAAVAFGVMAGASMVQAAEDDFKGFQAGDIMVRARAVGVLPQTDQSITSSTPGLTAALNHKIDITNSLIPELDLSYFVTRNLAFELIAGTTNHAVKDNGTALGNLNLGNVWLLPPTLTAQWHFLPDSKFNPYVGAGLNYTMFYGVDNSRITSGTSYRPNFGAAFQFGADYNVTGNWFVNVDVKKILLSTDVKFVALGAVPVRAKVDIDPWLVGLGIGYRF